MLILQTVAAHLVSRLTHIVFLFLLEVLSFCVVAASQDDHNPYIRHFVEVPMEYFNGQCLLAVAAGPSHSAMITGKRSV